jgi:hypothetical protein
MPKSIGAAFILKACLMLASLGAGNNRMITEASLTAKIRDLNNLIEQGAPMQNGKRPCARYYLATNQQNGPLRHAKV